MQAINDLPTVTRKRLVQLEELLKSWSGKKITSAKICELTGWKDSLVRHDLWLIGNSARGWKNGYNVAELLTEIQAINKNESQNVCIAGLGRLGAALLDENLFGGSQFVIKAGFDSNVNRVEILRSTFPLYPAAEMNWVIKQEKITLAILAVADKDAQTMCDRLVKAGIKGIVNMTRMVLSVPEGIKIENLSVLNALKMIS